MNLGRIHFIGSSMWFTGGVLVGMSIGYRVNSPIDSLVKSFLLVLGAALFGSGLCVRWCHFVDQKVIRVLDLIWICASALSLCLAVAQVFSSEFKLARSHIYLNLADAKEYARAHLMELERSCRVDPPLYAGPICGWASRMIYEIRSGTLRPEEVMEFCPKPVQFDHSLFSVCRDLSYVVSVQKEELFPEKASERRLDIMRFLLHAVVIIAVAARFPKSIWEVFLIKTSPRAKRLIDLKKRRTQPGR